MSVRHLIAASIIALAGTAQAKEWVDLNTVQPDGGRLFYDADSVRIDRRDQSVTLWFKIEYDQKQLRKGMPFTSYTQLNKSFCRENRYLAGRGAWWLGDELIDSFDEDRSEMSLKVPEASPAGYRHRFACTLLKGEGSKFQR